MSAHVPMVVVGVRGVSAARSKAPCSGLRAPLQPSPMVFNGGRRPAFMPGTQETPGKGWNLRETGPVGVPSAMVTKWHQMVAPRSLHPPPCTLPPARLHSCRPTSAPVTKRSGSCPPGRRALVPAIQLLLDDRRARRLIDAAPDRRATIVALVDRAQPAPRTAGRNPPRLAGADLVLDFPKCLVHFLQSTDQRVQRRTAADHLPLDGRQLPQFPLDVPAGVGPRPSSPA